jgi:zinc transport system substrate-binding protein
MITLRGVSAGEQLPVFVSIVPQKYFVQQIGKDLVDVQVMVQPGASPATYEPRPRQMAELAKARVYFAIGVPFEKAWLKKIAAANPEMKVIHTDRDIAKIPMVTHDHSGGKGRRQESEDPERDGCGTGRSILDPHIWLSPPLVKMQARRMLIALQEADPPHRSLYETNYRAFVSVLDQLDAQLKATFSGRQGLQFMVFHPAWGYFAHTYGLEQVPIEVEGKNPKPAQLQVLIERAREKNIQVVFVQPQFSTRSADIVAKEIGGQVAFADPLAENWLTNMRTVADKFKAALK